MVDRDAAEDERDALAERVRVDAEADAELAHRSRARLQPPSAVDRMTRKLAPRELGERVDRAVRGPLQPPPRPRRRWTATSPLPRVGSDVVVDPVADVGDLAGGDARRARRAARRTRGSGLRTPRLAEPVTTSTGSAADRAHSSSAAVWFPTIPTTQAGGADALEARERIRVQVGGRVDDRCPRRPPAARLPRWPQSSQCSSPRSIVFPSAAQTTCGPMPAARATARQYRSSSTSVSPTSKKTARLSRSIGGQQTGRRARGRRRWSP